MYNQEKIKKDSNLTWSSMQRKGIDNIFVWIDWKDPKNVFRVSKFLHTVKITILIARCPLLSNASDLVPPILPVSVQPEGEY